MNSTPQTFVSRHYQSTDGLRLHYRDYAGPADAPFTVICVPGLTRNARDFEALAPHLAARYRVLCVELRGRGLSQYATDPMTYVPLTYVRDIETLIDHAGLAAAALIGTSLGGLVSILCAAIIPAKVFGVVLNDAGTDIDPTGLARIRGYVGKAPPVVTWDDAAKAIQFLDGIIYPDYTAADWARTARRRFIENPDGTLRLDYDMNISKTMALPETTPDMWPYFRKLTDIPTLVLRGATSDILAAETVTRMKEAVHKLKAVEIPNRGHTPYLDEPLSLSAIDTFLAGLAR
jgi:pimeloyl-ACP methyl ester carboxylesterase